MLGKTNAAAGGVKRMGIPYVPYTFSDTFTKSKSTQPYPYFRYNANGGTLTAPIANNFCTIDNYIWNASTHYTYYKQYAGTYDIPQSLNSAIEELMSQIDLNGLRDGTHYIILSFVDDANIVDDNPILDMLADMTYRTTITISNGKLTNCSYAYIICKNNTSGSGRLYLTSLYGDPS